MPLFRITADGLQSIPERSYRDTTVSAQGEATLQRYIADHPDLIPGESIDPDDPPRFVTVQAEAGVTPGSMDVLLLDQNAVPTVIEAKLIDNREIRRSVVAQGLEYLAHLETEWSADRYASAGDAYWQARNTTFGAEVERRLGGSLNGDFLERAAANARSGALRLIVATDKVPPELLRLIEFTNTWAKFEVYGLELRYFAATGEEAILAPQLVGNSERARRGKATNTSSRWDRERFFEALAGHGDERLLALAESLLSFGASITARAMEPGTGRERGSFTARLVIDKERYSLFSVYTTAQVSLNMGPPYNDPNLKKAYRLQPGLGEKYRQRAEAAFGTPMPQSDWSYDPVRPMTLLLEDDGAAFKQVVKDFVAEIQALHAQADSSGTNTPT